MVSSYIGILENPLSTISSQTSFIVLAPSKASIEVLGVITSLALVSPKVTIECIISFSSSSMIPSAFPTFTKEIISSSVIISCGLVIFTPSILPTNLEINIKQYTTGVSIIDKT